MVFYLIKFFFFLCCCRRCRHRHNNNADVIDVIFLLFFACHFHLNFHVFFFSSSMRQSEQYCVARETLLTDNLMSPIEAIYWTNFFFFFKNVLITKIDQNNIYFSVAMISDSKVYIIVPT